MTTKPLLIILVGLSLMLTGCGEDPQRAQQTVSQPAAPGPQSRPSEQPQPQTVERSTLWPFLSSDQLEGTLAEDPIARNFLLIFDGSGSMGDRDCAGDSRKIEVAKKAVMAWSKSVPANANLGLYAFHDPGRLTLPLASGNRDAFMQTVNRIVAGGNTPLAEAMQYAYETFTEQGRRQLGYGQYTIVVVTDGRANSISDLEKAVDTILSQTPINIYSIGFCIDEHHSLNQPGRTTYKSADNPEQLQQVLREVLAESESFDELEFSQ
jgi:uncharacterized protein YegL